MKIDANVPTTTIMNAAADSNACMPAPLSTAPTSTATSARMKPMAERMSTVYFPAATLASSASMSAWSSTTMPREIHGTCGPVAISAAGIGCVVSSLSTGMGRVFSPLASVTRRQCALCLARCQRHGLAEHAFELDHQRDDTADDLPGEILVALGQQHLREMT